MIKKRNESPKKAQPSISPERKVPEPDTPQQMQKKVS